MLATLTSSHFVVIVTVVVRRQEILTWSQRAKRRTPSYGCVVCNDEEEQ